MKNLSYLDAISTVTWHTIRGLGNAALALFGNFLVIYRMSSKIVRWTQYSGSQGSVEQITRSNFTLRNLRTDFQVHTKNPPPRSCVCWGRWHLVLWSSASPRSTCYRKILHVVCRNVFMRWSFWFILTVPMQRSERHILLNSCIQATTEHFISFAYSAIL